MGKSCQFSQCQLVIVVSPASAQFTHFVIANDSVAAAYIAAATGEFTVDTFDNAFGVFKTQHTYTRTGHMQAHMDCEMASQNRGHGSRGWNQALSKISFY